MNQPDPGGTLVLWEWEDGSFDRVHIRSAPPGWVITGRHGDTRYVLTLDPDFNAVTLDATSGDLSCTLSHTPDGWRDADRGMIANTAGIRDLDLSWSAVTNTFPIRKLCNRSENTGTFDVLMITLPTLDAMPVRQSYTRQGTDWFYENTTTGFSAQLAVDKDALVTDYPGVCSRKDFG